MSPFLQDPDFQYLQIPRAGSAPPLLSLFGEEDLDLPLPLPLEGERDFLFPLPLLFLRSLPGDLDFLFL